MIINASGSILKHFLPGYMVCFLTAFAFILWKSEYQLLRELQRLCFISKLNLFLNYNDR